LDNRSFPRVMNTSVQVSTVEATPSVSNCDRL
jgi:hypothetical protein